MPPARQRRRSADDAPPKRLISNPGLRRRAEKLAHRAFQLGDRAGVHILPAHYYSPIARRKDLRRTEAAWRRPLRPVPFAWDVDAQAAWLVDTAGACPRELPLAEIYEASDAVGGFRYGPIEAQFLYSYIRKHAPRRILELGSGSSTLVMSRAVQRNVADGRQATEILACDPYTSDRVRDLPHVTARAIGGLQTDELIAALAPGDLLFIDSTHTVRTGSEVVHLYLEVVPQLAAGIIVHVHDIYLPYLFTPNIYTTLFDWQETALVAALLTGNGGLRILASMSGLFHARPDALHDAFPEYRSRVLVDGVGADEQGHYPSALWLEVVGDGRVDANRATAAR